MILEHALDVLPGREREFQAFDGARPLIARQRGFRSLRLERCLEQPNRYLLLVEWDELEDHTEGFRTSPEYGRWRELLHPFYEPFLHVDHCRSRSTAHTERPALGGVTAETGGSRVGSGDLVGVVVIGPAGRRSSRT